MDVQELANEVVGRTDVEARSEIDLRLAQAKTFTKDWHDNISRWRKLYDFSHYNNKPKPGETQFSDPTITNTVDLTVGILQSNEMIWQAKSFKPAGLEGGDTDVIEKYLKAVLDANADRNEYNIIFEINLHFARDGGAVLYTVWDNEIANMEMKYTEILDEESEDGVSVVKVYEHSPLRVEVVDPMKMSFLPGGADRWAATIREEKMSVFDVEATYGVTVERYSELTEEEKVSQMGSFIDYWDVSMVSSEVDGESKKVKVIRNAVMFEDMFLMGLREMPGYTKLPYTVSFFNPGSRDDSNNWNGIIRPLESTITLLERGINRRQHQIDVFSSLPMIAKTLAGRVINVDPGIGNLITMAAGEESVEFPVWPGNPPDIEEQIGFFRSRIQQSGFSDVMFGSGSSQVTGYALSQMGDQNRIRLEQPIAHLENLWTWWARKVMSLTLAFAKNSSIEVYGRVRGETFADMISGSDLAGYQVWCQIRPEFPNERVRNHAMATQVKGMLSDRTIMETYLGIQQPDDERTQRIIEMAQNHPSIMNYGLMSVLEELANAGDDPAAAKALEQLLAQGQTGQPGEEGSSPEQPMGLQGATGQPSPQALGNPTPGQSEGEMPGQLASASPNMEGGI